MSNVIDINNTCKQTTAVEMRMLNIIDPKMENDSMLRLQKSIFSCGGVNAINEVMERMRKDKLLLQMPKENLSALIDLFAEVSKEFHDLT